MKVGGLVSDEDLLGGGIEKIGLKEVPWQRLAIECTQLKKTSFISTLRMSQTVSLMRHLYPLSIA